MGDSYFYYLNVDILIEITSRLSDKIDIDSLSNEANIRDDDVFWKRLVLKRYPKRYKRDYDYRNLYIGIIEYIRGPIFDPELTSFLVYEDIMSRYLQKNYHTMDILTKNKDIDAIKKVLSENPDMINKYSWTKISTIALETENIDIINYTNRRYRNSQRRIFHVYLYSWK